MTGYVRKDTTNNIADGNVINAADLDSEFDGVQAAFNASTGHKHDGTAAEGATINSVGPTQDVTISATLVAPKTTNTIDIGSSALKFKDLFLAGNSSIGGTLAVTGVATLTAQPILSSLTASSAVATDASKGLVSVTNTGTGNNVLATSPTLVTPVLGTPSSGTLTNATGLPLTTGVTGTLPVANGGTGLTSFTSGGVVYASSTSALATGSALTFDGTNLSNSGYYIGTAAVGRLTKSNTTGRNLLTGGVTGGTTDGAYIITEGYDYGGTAAGGAIQLVTAGASSPITMLINGSEQMRLTSTGLGIGTSSPAYKLHVYTNSATPAQTTTESASAGVNAEFIAKSTAATWRMGTNIGLTGGQWEVYGGSTPSSKIALDSSGNLGLGVTPTGKAKFEVYTGAGAYAGISTRFNATNLPISFGITNANGVPYLGVNARQVSGTDGQTYDIDGFASQMWCNGGGFAFFTAPSGTAGNAISFTQAMTLDASGNLGISETSPSTFGKLVVKGGAINLVTDTAASRRLSFWSQGNGNSENAYIQVQNDGGTTNTGEILFATRNVAGTLAERARIDASGNFIQSAPTTAPSLSTNGTMVFNLTSNTNLRVSVRGSDGVTRTANITLA